MCLQITSMVGEHILKRYGVLGLEYFYYELPKEIARARTTKLTKEVKE